MAVQCGPRSRKLVCYCVTVLHFLSQTVKSLCNCVLVREGGVSVWCVHVRVCDYPRTGHRSVYAGELCKQCQRCRNRRFLSHVG